MSDAYVIFNFPNVVQQQTLGDRGGSFYYSFICSSSENAAVKELLQESCAIAKMTAQCAIYIGALKIFGTP